VPVKPAGSVRGPLPGAPRSSGDHYQLAPGSRAGLQDNTAGSHAHSPSSVRGSTMTSDATRKQLAKIFGPDRGSQVRSVLAAGEGWIRTLGPPRQGQRFRDRHVRAPHHVLRCDKAIRISNPKYRPGTFLKIAGRTVGSAGGNIILLPMRVVQDRH
jgi:hypothetical protein